MDSPAAYHGVGQRHGVGHSSVFANGLVGLK